MFILSKCLFADLKSTAIVESEIFEKRSKKNTIIAIALGAVVAMAVFIFLLSLASKDKFCRIKRNEDRMRHYQSLIRVRYYYHSVMCARAKKLKTSASAPTAKKHWRRQRSRQQNNF